MYLTKPKNLRKFTQFNIYCVFQNSNGLENKKSTLMKQCSKKKPKCELDRIKLVFRLEDELFKKISCKIFNNEH